MTDEDLFYDPESVYNFKVKKVARVPSGEKMHDLVVRDGYALFWGEWPSNWTWAPFTLDGVRYNCTEQHMMAEKARLFKDEQALRHIMKATDPANQKRYGRQVKGFDERRWSSVCYDIVLRGNLEKYRQNPELCEKLLATGNLHFVEASPKDKVWGIGMDKHHPDATKPRQMARQKSARESARRNQAYHQAGAWVVSQLVDFYAGAGKDHAGRKIDDIWAWDEDKLENVHDYIQWLFPNRAPSRFNPEAPLLTDEDAQAFKESTYLSSRVLRSFDMMCAFYRVGSMQCKRAGVNEGPPYWWDSFAHSHNWLRMTRIMLCMTEVGYQDNAKTFLECIEKATLPDSKTRLFWRAAAGVK